MKKSILDPSFKYTPSSATDLRKTFARIRREEAAKAKQAAIVTEPILDWADRMEAALQEAGKDKEAAPPPALILIEGRGR